MAVTDADMPALHRAADSSSVDAQRLYLWLVRTDLLLLVLGAISTSWASTSPFRTALALGGAAALIVSLVLTILLLQLKLERTWFGARAVAESVKTVAWRYMTGADPYARDLAPLAVDERFCAELAAILRERRDLGAALGGDAASADQITEAMREVRASDLEARKETYVRDRIKDQRGWYTRKSSQNRQNARNWLITVAAMQGLGAVFAVALVGWPELRLNLAALFTTLAAAFMAWLQVKQHQELSHSYALAAQELGVIEAKSRHLEDDSVFASFVSDAENAISREHTMWVARRDQI